MDKLNCFNKEKVYRDDYSTPSVYFEILRDLLVDNLDVKYSCIWDPFWNDGSSKEILERCFPEATVIHKDLDFFSIKDSGETDIIITNPPFSILGKVCKRMFEMGLPFIMLLPLNSLSNKYFKHFDSDHISIILLPKVAWGDHKTKLHIPLCWMLYKIPDLDFKIKFVY